MNDDLARVLPGRLDLDPCSDEFSDSIHQLLHVIVDRRLGLRTGFAARLRERDRLLLFLELSSDRRFCRADGHALGLDSLAHGDLV